MASGVDPTQFIRPELKTLKYHGVDSVKKIAKEVGMNVSDLIKLDANENVYGPHSSVLDALRDVPLHIYPDPSQEIFRKAVGKFHKIDPKMVVGGSGSDDILDILIRVVSPKKIVVCSPTFGMYSFLAKLQGAQIIDVPRLSKNFEVDFESLIKTIREEKAEMVMIASPNNPTGNVFSQKEIQSLCQEQILVVIDEAYADFRDDQLSAISLLPQFQNLIVTRTLSKWAGLAGLRVGYSICHPSFSSVMMSIKQPYNINCAAEAGALAAFESYQEIFQNTIQPLSNERNTLFQRLEEEISWLKPFRSQANFVLTKVLRYNPLSLKNYLRRKGILIRYFGTQGGALLDFVRFSSGKKEHTQSLLSALHSFPKSQGILFDMDGVIADVSTSYRRAIIETSMHFGAEVTEKDIAIMKMKGNANNDWIVSKRLIEEKISISVTLQDVTDEFERRYQGGLYQTEKLLIDPLLFSSLIEKGYKLGLVTGRPRGDAIRFLQDFNLSEYFGDNMVCMSETKDPKPSPDPVLLCMKKMGISEAVMIGDTVDDIKSAISSGVIAFGVVAPGARDPHAEREAMKEAGASAILELGLTNLLDELQNDKKD